MTRRDLTMAFAAPALAPALKPLMAQQAPATEDLNALSREQVKRSIDQLRKLRIPIATEPSFAFHP